MQHLLLGLACSERACVSLVSTAAEGGFTVLGSLWQALPGSRLTAPPGSMPFLGYFLRLTSPLPQARPLVFTPDHVLWSVSPTALSLLWSAAWLL